MNDLQPYILTSDHLEKFDRFTCGDEEWCVTLNDFLRENAIPEGADRFNTTYVFYDAEDAPVAYTTLSASQIPRADSGGLPLLKSSAPYPFTPALLIGRIAVDRHQQGKKHGTAILGWIEKMAIELPVGCRFLALHVDERNSGAIRLYQEFGFISPEHLKPRKHQKLMLYDLIDLEAELGGDASSEQNSPS